MDGAEDTDSLWFFIKNSFYIASDISITYVRIMKENKKSYYLQMNFIKSNNTQKTLVNQTFIT